MFARLLSLVSILISAAAGAAQTSYSHPDATQNLVSVAHSGGKSFVGGVDYIMVVDRNTGDVETISMKGRKQEIMICQSFGASSECANSILLIAMINSTHLITCGSNVLKPTCYRVDLQTYEVTEVRYYAGGFLGVNPYVHSPAVVIKGDTEDPQLYVAGCTGNGRCSLNRRMTTRTLKTYSNRNLHSGLNRAVYTGIYPTDDNEMVYLFYRDKNNAFDNDKFVTSASTNEYGMVAKICTRDEGGFLSHSSKFVTFLSARLLCPFPGGSVTGNANAYYNVLSATYRVGNIVYGLFTFPKPWGIPASAVCAYDLDTIDRHMNGSVFPNGNTEYYDPDEPNFSRTLDRTSSILLGQCPSANETVFVTSSFVTLIKETTLLRRNIPPLNRRPSFITTSTRYRFLTAVKAGAFHIIYLLNDNNVLTKVRLDTQSEGNSSVIFERKVKVIGTILSFSVVEQDLVFVTPTEMVTFPPSDCSMHVTCSACEMDPHCNWVLKGDSLHCELDTTNVFAVDSCPSTPSAPGPVVISGSLPSLTITWDAPDDGSNVTSYAVEVTRKFDNHVAFQTNVQPDSLQVTNPDIPVGTVYIVSVRAINQRAVSKVATSEFTADLQQPTLTVVEISETSSRLLWSWIPTANSYNISLYMDDDNNLVRSYIATPEPTKSQQTLQISDLTPNKNYTAVVFGISPYGVNSPSAFSDFMTKDDPLGAASLGFIIVLVVLVIIVLFTVIVLLQNRYSIGIKTKQIKSGEEEIKLQRKYLLFWSQRRIKGQERLEKGASQSSGSSRQVYTDSTVDDERLD